MGELAERLADFLWSASRESAAIGSVVDDLRMPRGHYGHMRGSALGEQLWSSPQATALLDLVTSDQEYLSVFGGNWDPRDEARRTLAEVFACWESGHARPPIFAESVEEQVWRSLRRTHVRAGGVTVVEGFIAPPGGIELPLGRFIVPPSEHFMARMFSKVWPDYSMRLPRGPFALFISNIEVPRRYYGGVMAQSFAMISSHLPRDLVWLATGTAPVIGHTVTWDDDMFPVAPPTHFERDAYLVRPEFTIELENFRPQLEMLMPRVAARASDNDDQPSLDDDTLRILRHIEAQVHDALSSRSTSSIMMLTFAIAEHLLTYSNEHPRERGGVSGQIPDRFGLLCGANKEDRRSLAGALKALHPVRRAIAHGGPVDPFDLAAFLRTDVATDDADDVFARDKRSAAARAAAIELLRRMYRAWLMAILDVTDGVVCQRMSAADLIGLVSRARTGDLGALAQLESFNQGA